MRFEIDADTCVGCLACLRVCASKAITVDGATVRINDDTCIRSGECVSECPHDAIRAVGDVERAVALLEAGEAVLILAVEAAAHFYPCTPEQVVNACYRAGFSAVHSGILGDELVAKQYDDTLTVVSRHLDLNFELMFFSEDHLSPFHSLWDMAPPSLCPW